MLLAKTWIHPFSRQQSHLLRLKFAQSAVAVEYTDYTFTEG